MNVIAYRAGRCIYLCDFRNDYDNINTILENSTRKAELDTAQYRVQGDRVYDEEVYIAAWNNQLTLVLEILEENGCTIMWDN
jgi:hypothetical protein